MSIELPKDAEGREIPLDTVALFNRVGNVYSIVRGEDRASSVSWSPAPDKVLPRRASFRGYANGVQAICGRWAKRPIHKVSTSVEGRVGAP